MGCLASRSKVRQKPPRLDLPLSERPSLLRPATESTGLSAHTSPVITWKQGQLLKQGVCGSVYQALNVNTGQIYALKRLTLSIDPERRLKEIAKLKREFSMLQELNHENIVKYLQVEVEPDQSAINLVLEYVPCGSVLTILCRTLQCEEGMVRTYTKQLLRGLAYLHSRGIIHRDIKCSNILVDAIGRVKITDFSSCIKVSGDKEEPAIRRKLAGSPYWMAPEVARRVGHSFPADIWSAGCAVIEMISRRAPWSDVSTNSKEVLELIGGAQGPPAYPDSITVECRAFLDCCLQVKPEKRASADQLLTHCFITGDKVQRTESLPLISLRSKLNSPVLRSAKARPNIFFSRSLLTSLKTSHRESES